MKTQRRIAIVIASLSLSSCIFAVSLGCGSSDTDTETSAEGGELVGLFDEGLFASDPTLVDCTLTNGASATCYQFSFANYEDSSGPFCPATENDIGGVGIYDGDTNPGFQVLKKALWDAMETDGFDVLDDEGNVRKGGGANAGCINMEAEPLTLTFLIPTVPQMLDEPDVIDIVELYGVSVYDGMPLTGHPPSVVDGPPMPGASGGGIPSLDPCGGHPDPAGYWHWHFSPENTQSVLESFGITDVSCDDVPQKTEGLVGIAKDGYPIYSPLENGAVPDGLDDCNGKFGVTTEFPDGIYHYYARDKEAPNLPTCVVGASARNVLGFQ